MKLEIIERTLTDDAGNLLEGAAVTVREGHDSGGDLAELFSDSAGATAVSNPVTVASGTLSVYAQPGRYRLEGTSSAGDGVALISTPIFVRQLGLGLPDGVEPEQITNFNDDIPSGYYQAAGNIAVDNPDGESYLATVEVKKTSGQAHFEYNRSSTSDPRKWFGVRNQSTGSIAWRRVVLEDMIIGTVSQSGGDPTGSIIERGSNANGEYVRFADGTQICTVDDFNMGSIVGSGVGTFADPYRTGTSVTVTWPAAFAAGSDVAAVPMVRLSGDSAVSPDARTLFLQPAVAPQSTEWSNLRAVRLSASALNRDALLSIVAVGRWF